MISAYNQLRHAVESFSEEEAKKALDVLLEYAPELFGRETTYKRYPVTCDDGRVVMVSIPEREKGGKQ
jgi:hypothetical protein